jgi:hypothetical protein
VTAGFSSAGFTVAGWAIDGFVVEGLTVAGCEGRPFGGSGGGAKTPPLDFGAFVPGLVVVLGAVVFGAVVVGRREDGTVPGRVVRVGGAASLDGKAAKPIAAARQLVNSQVPPKRRRKKFVAISHPFEKGIVRIDRKVAAPQRRSLSKPSNELAQSLSKLSLICLLG